MVPRNSDQDRIATLLAAYGSDLSRWPPDGRAAVAALPADERAALLREDWALDRLIVDAAEAGDQSPPSDDLIARILAAAPAQEIAEPRNQSSGEVVALRVAKSADPAVSTVGGRPVRDWVAAAALMAASLALGIFVGSTDRGQIVTQSVGDLAGVSLSASSVQMTALDEALQSQDDEDIL